HQEAGSCSAQPGCSDRIAASFSGYCVEAIFLFEWASMTDTFIDEVPKSIPNNNIFFFLHFYLTLLNEYCFPAIVSTSYSYIFFILLPLSCACGDIKAFGTSIRLFKIFGLAPLASFKFFPVNCTWVRIRRLPPIFENTLTFATFPFDHSISISNPPRAIIPSTTPFFHASGKAGNRCTAPS